jgi:site-specific DNA-methyltransferase (adenine-specific)
MWIDNVNNMQTLTKRQKQILDYIEEYIKKNSISPTYEEIKKRFKLSALSTVYQHVEALINKNYLIKNEHSSRGIEVKKIVGNFIQIPLKGTIAAGQPIEAIEERETIAVPKINLPKSANLFALRVSGDSMIGENINDGDIVIIKSQSTADNGQKIVALIDNCEVTLKKIYKERGRIRLQPANLRMIPIYVKPENLMIQGVVIDVVKNIETKNIIITKRVTNLKKENKLKDWLNTIRCMDCVEAMKQLPDNSIDLVVTSPPYDSMRDYKGFSYDLHAAGKEIYRVLKDGGMAVMIIQDQTKNFGKSLTSFKTIVDWCDNIGFKLFETAIYRKYGAEGAWWNKRFRVDHEYMPIFLKGERPQYFNKEPLKIPSKHGGKTMTGGGTRLTNGVRIATRSITINPMKCRGTIWEYMTAGDGTRLKHQHPATFPDKLPIDFIQCFCPPKGVVLDPFIGSGTTALAAIKLERNYIGIDVSEDYCELSKKRLKEEGAVNLKLF